MKANTSSNISYSQARHYLNIEFDEGSEEFLKAVKQAGYKYSYRWINSDNNWAFLATNEARAKEGAAELYAKEMKTDIKYARKYASEYIDVISIDELVNE